ncbi:hypothetical protein SAMN05216489_05364 [Streptomyces sp. 3213]|nr:hypothetical protein SAMN05216489_05364 [Streptomyces sp. 3213] [Streptomyces sp. 3213.3]
MRRFIGRDRELNVLGNALQAVHDAAWSAKAGRCILMRAVRRRRTEPDGTEGAGRLRRVQDGTVAPMGSSTSAHRATWHFAHTVPGIREWVMDQSL